MNADILRSYLDRTTRQYSDCLNCGRTIPAWMDRQVNGIHQMAEGNFSRGAALYHDGIKDEIAHLDELLDGLEE